MQHAATRDWQSDRASDGAERRGRSVGGVVKGGAVKRLAEKPGFEPGNELYTR